MTSDRSCWPRGEFASMCRAGAGGEGGWRTEEAIRRGYFVVIALLSQLEPQGEPRVLGADS